MKKISILYLYPNEMNIYGDTGNVLTLQKRLEWRGYEADIQYHHPGKKLATDGVDIIVGGGGQDSGQLKVCDDLQKVGPQLVASAESGTPMLVICGMYQLFGKRFVTLDGTELPGIGIFDMETLGTEQRLIGPIVFKTTYGELVGYENHSGQTTLAARQKAFGTVVRGYGNNASRKEEGAVSQNVYGSYSHGSLLPKNPGFADGLIGTAINRKYGTIELKRLDDTLAAKARTVASKR